MLKWKWILIGGLSAASILFIWQRQIRLGLDLRGGIELIIRVDTDDAVRAELDEAVSQLRTRLEENKVPYQQVERQLDASSGVYEVVTTLPENDDGERVRRTVEAVLAGYARDMRGNTVVASVPIERVAALRSTTVEQAITTITERVNATGVVEPDIRGLPDERILVQLPGVEDPEHVKRLIGRVAFLELKLVDAGPFASRDLATQNYAARTGGSGLPPGLEIVEGLDDQARTVFYVVERTPVVTGRDLIRAQPSRDELGQPSVSFTLNSEGARKFGDATGRSVGRQLAIILDGRVKSAPVIRSRISDQGQIEGAFTAQEARDLSLVLRAGALPAKIQYLGERTVGPFLGKDSIRKGSVAGLVGLLLIVVTMVIYYRRSGLNAVVALVLNALLLLGAVSAMGATLTLPGIAGIILTLGMAVDANVLVFEAIREFLRNGMTPKRAIGEGFERAFTTIVDSNLTTIGAAAALWMLGYGPVRGFGVTLVIGLLISMFTSYYVSKTMFETFVLRRDMKPGETLSI